MRDPFTNYPMLTPYQYRWRAPGFLRMNVCGWRFMFIDRRKCHPCYSDRAHGWNFGPFIFRVHRLYPAATPSGICPDAWRYQ